MKIKKERTNIFKIKIFEIESKVENLDFVNIQHFIPYKKDKSFH